MQLKFAGILLKTIFFEYLVNRKHLCIKISEGKGQICHKNKCADTVQVVSKDGFILIV